MSRSTSPISSTDLPLKTSVGDAKIVNPSVPVGIPGVTQGRESALAEIGIPPLFANQLKEQALKGSFAFALRGNHPFQVYQIAHTSSIDPKQGMIKAKNSNWGFVQGAIPVNYALLGKIEKNGQIREMDFKKEFKSPERIGEEHLPMSLSMIMQGLNAKPPEYDLVGDPNKDGMLRVKKHTDPSVPLDSKIKDVIFSINLNDSKSVKSHTTTREALEKVHIGKIEELTKPTWWDDKKLGDFSEKQNLFFPSYVQANANATPEKLMVYAVKTAGRLSTIRPDQDLLWITRPVVPTEKSVPDMNTPFNTFKPTQLSALIEVLEAYTLEKTGKPLEITSDNAIGHAVAAMGCVTAVEAFHLLEANKNFTSDLHVKFIGDLFRHGAENRNPYLPSDLDGKMLHIWNGEFYVTHSERELVEFVLKMPGYLEKNIIDIHPGWDMGVWGPVVKRQMELYPDQVSDKTKSAYTEGLTIESLAVQAVHPMTRSSREADAQPAALAVNFHSTENSEKIKALVDEKKWEYDANMSAIIIDHKDRIFVGPNNLRANGATGNPLIMDALDQIIKKLDATDKVAAKQAQGGITEFKAVYDKMKQEHPAVQVTSAQKHH